MGVRKLKCESCGANLEVDDQLTIGFCQYCGSKFMLEDKVSVSVKVEIDHKNDNKIKMANQYMQDGNYEKAEKIFKNVLEDDITNYEAWWGRYLCVSYYSRYYGYTDRYGDTSPSIKASILAKNLQYAYNAIQNAPTEIAEEYKSRIVSFEKFVREHS